MERNTVIIVGSNGDTGSQIVKDFNENNWEVIGLSREKNNEICDINLFINDFREINQLESIIPNIVSDNRKIKCLIICIGRWSTTNNLWDKTVFENNFIIVKNIYETFVPIFIEQNYGRIILISSIDSLYPNVNSFSYSISKTAASSISKLYKKKYRETNVNFDVISPGGINTKNRKNKENKSYILQTEDISDLCFYLANTNSRVAFEDFIMFPKTFQYSK
tara:strand:- start:151 stop:813 length:663 start_codon:yes stop_codon:yes gene_type:complete